MCFIPRLTCPSTGACARAIPLVTHTYASQAIKNIPVRSKRYITKVMFLTVVGRPIPELDHDGKLYIRRCSRPHTAKRPSKYHETVSLIPLFFAVLARATIARR
jgi:hypothetical protein